jgi:hypothetical protein
MRILSQDLAQDLGRGSVAKVPLAGLSLAQLKRLGPGVFQVEMTYHDFALIVVE